MSSLPNVYSFTRYSGSYYVRKKFHPLKILMWKHFKERKRRFFFTIWETLSGVLIFSMVVASNIFYDRMIESTSLELIIDAVLFLPNNNLTMSYMHSIEDELKNKHNSSNLLGAVLRAKGFKRVNDVVDHINRLNSSKTSAVINFKDFNGKTLPNQLNYTMEILRTGQYNTDNMLKLHAPTAHRHPFLAQRTSSFLSELQWAIDKVFLQRLSGENITHNIDIQLKDDITNIFIQLAMFSTLSIYTTLAPLPFFLINTSRLVNIRRTGLKELMRMVGISSNIFRVSHLLDTAVLATVYSVLNTIVLKVPAKPILKKTDALIVFVTFMLQLINIKTLTFITSTLTQDYAHSGGVALLIYLITIVLDTPWLSHHVKCTPYAYILCLILPHLPMNLFWYEVTYMENVATDMTHFINIFRCYSGICFPVIYVWLFFVLQIIVTTVLAWYLDLVRPGRYGMAEKWDFLCERRFWRPKRKAVTFHVTAEQTRKLLRDDRFFQKGPMNAEVVVKVVKVSKAFKVFRHRDIVALDHVSLDLYRGEVTMLLGPNGAGKTSLLSIITGMYSATHGKVYVKGFDNVKRIQEIREDIGFCPQHNMTFDYLTVRENIVFFQRLRGINSATKHVHGSVDKLLSKLKLISKADCYSHQLSLGMKRCLQVAIALASGAEILVLDEPTSGMDSPSRHSLWDLILTLRGHVSILMTTTCLGEADVLGDRIGFLLEGKLKCYGTPSFLKNAIGTGFNLSLTLKESNKIVFVEDEVRKVVDDVTYKKWGGKKVVFTLPLKDRELFPKLFDMLEEKKEELTITAIEIGMAIDELFMEFIEEEDDESEFNLNSYINLEDTKLKGCQLLAQQTKTLMRRNFKYLMTRKNYVLVFQILIPILIIIFGTLHTNGTEKSYMKSDKRLLYYNTGPFRRSAVLDLVNRSHDIDAFKSENVTKDLKTLIRNTYNEMNTRLLGIEMKPNISHLVVPIKSQSSLTDAVNTFSNLYMSLHMPYIVESGIRSSYKEFMASDNMNYPKSAMNSYIWTLAVMFSVTFVLTPLVWMSIREYQNGVRYNHVIAGCPPLLLWIAKLMFHMGIYLLAVPITVLLASNFLEKDSTINEYHFLLALITMLLIFALAFLVHLYVLGFLFDENHAVTYIYDMSIWFGLVSPLLRTALLDLRDIGYKVGLFTSILTAINHISPVFTLHNGLLDLISVARSNSYCFLNKHLCPNIVLPIIEGANTVNKTCCESPSTHPYRYYTALERGLLNLVILIAQFFIYLIILHMLQNGVIQHFIDYIHGCGYKEPSPKYKHPEVLREKLYVKEKMATLREHKGKDPQPNGDVLIVENLHKNFHSSTERRRYCAVKGVSFALKQGECLGIFGPSGSGKTSTLYMITGFCIKSKGDAWAGGYFFNKNRNKYLGNIALATAFGIDDFLSGFENLTLISELHGHSTKLAEKFALRTLNSLGLQSVSHARCSTYSHGCLQRLAVCGALLVEPLVALFDEPAHSVDPRARPLVARALTRIVDTGRPIVLIEHNMSWQLIESLCDRIAIMLHGEVAVMGITRQVREAVASGYSARLRLLTNVIIQESDDASDEFTTAMTYTQMLRIRRASAVDKLKLEFETQFDSSLIAEHRTTLYYHINDEENTLLYSTMFTKLENLKSKFSYILEDYFLSETSIEDVFRRIDESSRSNYAK